MRRAALCCMLVFCLLLLSAQLSDAAISIREHSGTGYDGNYFSLDSYVVNETGKIITLNTTFTGPYPGVIWIDHDKLLNNYKVVVNITNKSAYSFRAMEAELYDIGEDGTSPIKYAGWSQSNDGDALDFNQESPNDPPRTSNVWSGIKADEFGEQDWLDYYNGTLASGASGYIQFGLDNEGSSNKPFLLELVPNKSWTIVMYARYDFTYYYNNGSGDYYRGYFYAATNLGYDVNYVKNIAADENGQPGYYKITKVTYQGFSSTNNKKVYVNYYYDHEGGGGFTPINASLPMGTNYMGSEHGYIIQANNANYHFGQADKFYEADVPWIKVKEHSGPGYNGSYFVLNGYSVDYVNRVLTINSTSTGPYPGVLWFDHAADALDNPYKVIINIKNNSAYDFIAMEAELYDIGEDGTSPIKYAGWSQSNDSDGLHFNQGSPSNPPRTSDVFTKVKADEFGEQDWLDYYDGKLEKGKSGYIQFGLRNEINNNKPFLLELTPNKSWTIPVYIKYDFTYYYNDGKGDFYNGYFYAAASAGYDVNYVKKIATDENGQPGYYKITKATYAGFLPTDNKKVYVTKYYDFESNLYFTPVKSTSPMGSNYIGSEYGYILQHNVVAYRFGQYLTKFYEADAYNIFYFTYYYGQGDRYSGYVYAPVTKYYPGYKENVYNETGNIGYYYISGGSYVSVPSTSLGRVYVTNYYDGETKAYLKPVISLYPEGYFGYEYLGSEHGYVIKKYVNRGDYFFGFGYYEADEVPVITVVNR